MGQKLTRNKSKLDQKLTRNEQNSKDLKVWANIVVSSCTNDI